MSKGNIIAWTIFPWFIYFRLITVRPTTEIRGRELIVAMRGHGSNNRCIGGRDVQLAAPLQKTLRPR
jgi:hypothetical protein